ncbi:MAG: aminotransferase class III-fold pyridoxal phosphate-dependent enzyme [Acidimicrobiia bacterium]|nr:aminotransferase class III-fold pyridoxal phosphate-dependent enzyme [Acidimicrobiia bacterium]
MTEYLSRSDDALAPILAYSTDILADRAEGLWIYDQEGNRYADFACGTAVTNLGHNHPNVIAAARAQMDRVVHAGCVFRYESIIRLAEKLRTITPPGIEKFGFANSGAEAVEAAVKLARHVTGRQGVITMRGAFHGRTMGSVAYTTSNARYRDGYHPILGSVFVTPFPRPYRWGKSADESTQLALDELGYKFKHEVTPKNIAAFLIEPMQGEGGYYPSPPTFLEALRELADQHGIMLIFDEVQSGFGRTAEWFSSDHYTVDPDIIAMGKAIANGLPLSSYGASADVLDRWPVGAHGTTFGGNPVSCAAAGAVIDTMQTLLPHARELSAHAFERLHKLQVTHDTIGEVRGLGLMIGIELVKDLTSREPDADAMKFVSRYALEDELIVISCGPDGNVIRFIPPLITTIEELDRAIDTIDAALTEYEVH